MKLVAVHAGETLDVEVERTGSGHRVRVNGREHEVSLVAANAFVSSLLLSDGSQYLLLHRPSDAVHEISFGNRTVKVEMHDPLEMRRKRDDVHAGDGRVAALMPGRVVRVLVEVGAEVTRGTPLLILEAMKMENELTSSCDGVVREILVSDGMTVDSGAPLLVIE